MQSITNNIPSASQLTVSKVIQCFSYLAKDVAYEPAAGDIPWMVKVFHDGIKPDWYRPILFQITASKFRVLLTEDQWLPGLKWRLVVQTLRVTAPPPGLEEQQQDREEEVRDEGALQDVTGDQITDL